MSFINKAFEFFGLSEEELAADSFEPSYSTAAVKPQTVVPQPKSSVQPKPKQIKVKNQGNAPAEIPVKHSNETVVKEKKVVSMTQPKGKKTAATNVVGNGKITILEPRTYAEAQAIAKHILNAESVLVNFHLVDEEQARRIVDFLTGTVYAQNGDIKRVGDEIFLCTPAGMEIEAQQSLENNLFDL